jgi:hypothetical protein
MPIALLPPPTHGGDDIGQATVIGEHLRARFAADDGVEVAHHARIRIGTGDGADDVERIADVGHPVAHRFVERVLERLRTAGHRHDGRAEQPHAIHVDLLALDVGRAHVHDALQPRRAATVADATPCWPAPVSAMIRCLPMRRASSAWPMVLLILCAPVWFRSSRLRQDARAADFFRRQARSFVDRARAADVMLEVVFEFCDEGRVDARRVVSGGELLQRADQGFGHEPPAEAAEVAGRIGSVAEIDQRGAGVDRLSLGGSRHDGLLRRNDASYRRP